MFSDVGKAIKKIAFWAALIEGVSVIAGFIACLVLHMVLYAFIVLIVGGISVVVSAAFLEGYGELIEKTTRMEEENRQLVGKIKSIEKILRKQFGVEVKNNKPKNSNDRKYAFETVDNETDEEEKIVQPSKPINDGQKNSEKMFFECPICNQNFYTTKQNFDTKSTFDCPYCKSRLEKTQLISIPQEEDTILL